MRTVYSRFPCRFQSCPASPRSPKTKGEKGIPERGSDSEQAAKAWTFKPRDARRSRAFEDSGSRRSFASPGFRRCRGAGKDSIRYGSRGLSRRSRDETAIEEDDPGLSADHSKTGSQPTRKRLSNRAGRLQPMRNPSPNLRRNPNQKKRSPL